jgi:hypothetical protein
MWKILTARECHTKLTAWWVTFLSDIHGNWWKRIKGKFHNIFEMLSTRSPAGNRNVYFYSCRESKNIIYAIHYIIHNIRTASNPLKNTPKRTTNSWSRGNALGGARFESRQGHRLSYLRCFVVLNNATTASIQIFPNLSSIYPAILRCKESTQKALSMSTSNVI